MGGFLLKSEFMSLHGFNVSHHRECLSFSREAPGGSLCHCSCGVDAAFLYLLSCGRSLLVLARVPLLAVLLYHGLSWVVLSFDESSSLSNPDAILSSALIVASFHRMPPHCHADVIKVPKVVTRFFAKKTGVSPQGFQLSDHASTAHQPLPV